MTELVLLILVFSLSPGLMSIIVTSHKHLANTIEMPLIENDKPVSLHWPLFNAWIAHFCDRFSLHKMRAHISAYANVPTVLFVCLFSSQWKEK